MLIQRRKIVFTTLLLATSKWTFAQKLKSNLSLVWTGFGLNGSFAQDRFQLTREYIKLQFKKDIRDKQDISFLIQQILQLNLAKTVIGAKNILKKYPFAY